MKAIEYVHTNRVVTSWCTMKGINIVLDHLRYRTTYHMLLILLVKILWLKTQKSCNKKCVDTNIYTPNIDHEIIIINIK